MSASVCVLTARGMAAIASLALKGSNAPAILEKVFRRAGGSHPTKPGSILHGSIVDGETVIDEVVVGCEDGQFVIHCHGNPLLIEQIIKLCQAQGATLVNTEPFFAESYRSQSDNMLESEAKLAVQTCATLSGAKLIANQLTHGLLPTVKKWLDEFDTMTLQELWAQCHQVLRKTSRGKFFINRCQIVIVGPPNSGKSTLLNRLAGRDEVIVTDTAGTTRDWVRITCRVGPLLADIYDTAGLDASLLESDVENKAQQTTLDLVRSADMNLFVYDIMTEYQAQSLLFSLGSLKAVIIANKCDLLTAAQRNAIYSKYVRLCAKTGDGIEQLIQKLLETLKIADFNLLTPVCFTDRQLTILRQILRTKDKPAAQKHLQTLLSGDTVV
jgi:tRNA modification GTPase